MLTLATLPTHLKYSVCSLAHILELAVCHPITPLRKPGPSLWGARIRRDNSLSPGRKMVLFSTPSDHSFSRRVQRDSKWTCYWPCFSFVDMETRCQLLVHCKVIWVASGVSYSVECKEGLGKSLHLFSLSSNMNSNEGRELSLWGGHNSQINPVPSLTPAPHSATKCVECKGFACTHQHTDTTSAFWVF